MSEAPRRVPSDESIRREVTDPAHSFLVQAPAGSGKTSLLVQRYLRLLARVQQPEEIVAVTFTRKAAAEMRGRILRQLGPAADDPFAAPAQARNLELGWRLRETPARLRVVTFDALALALASRMPWRARTGPAPRPSERPEELYREAARRFLAGGTLAARAVLTLGRARTRQLGDMLVELLKTRDQWQGTLDRMRRETDLRGVLAEELGRRRVELLKTARDLIQAAGWGELLPRLARKASATSYAKEAEALRPCRDLHGLPAVAEAAWPQWLALTCVPLTLGGRPRASGRNLGLGPEEFASLRPSPELVAVLHEIREAPEMASRDWRAIPALLETVPRLLDELQAVFVERGECDFIAITEAAVAALGGDAAPSDLAFALDGSLQHLLVDEAQDTSPSQFELLKALIREWQPALDGRTLFLVGDAMQSIYGFRNADVRQFKRLLRSERLADVPLKKRAVQANFRSSEELVNWCGKVFRPVAPPETYLEGVPTQKLPGAAVRWHIAADNDARAEAEDIVRLVRATWAEDPAGSLAVLVANRRHGSALLPALTRAGLPVEAVKLLTLEQSPVVQDLLALTRALLDPADRVAWLALLRAPWCGLRLADLAALCEGDVGTPLPELLRRRSASLSPDGRGRADRLLAALAPALRAAGRTPPRGLVEWAWRRLGAATWLPPAQRNHAAAFFDLIERLAAGGALADADRLEREAASLFLPPAPGGANPVQLMTMHQAKGLEFDTVVLPGLHRHGRNGGPYPMMVWHDDEGRVLVANGLAGELRRFVRRAKRADERAEQLRLMYVACTRARRRLHLFAHIEPEKLPHAGSPLARLWPALAAEPLEAAPRPAAPAEGATAPPPLRRVPEAWLPPAPAPALSWRPPAGPARTASLPAYGGLAARAVGLAVHAMLHRMAAARTLHWEPARLATLLRAGGASGDAALAAATQALARIVASPRGQWILAPHAEAANELALSGLVGGELRHGTLDRSFVDTRGVRWVIDYKTGSAPTPQQREQHRRQVETYAALLAARPGAPLRCGLYYLLRDEWEDWTPPPP